FVGAGLRPARTLPAHTGTPHGSGLILTGMEEARTYGISRVRAERVRPCGESSRSRSLVRSFASPAAAAPGRQ
ncbi:MAG TPA: hypothetical protein VN397_01915, partial [Candidatus Methylomirabilis sp.]|nr:hypothetical protein [Candidatus Methylomirabilis sp.]